MSKLTIMWLFSFLFIGCISEEECQKNSRADVDAVSQTYDKKIDVLERRLKARDRYDDCVNEAEKIGFQKIRLNGRLIKPAPYCKGVPDCYDGTWSYSVTTGADAWQATNDALDACFQAKMDDRDFFAWE